MAVSLARARPCACISFARARPFSSLEIELPFSQSNSDSDEDYILIEKEEGVAAEAAAAVEAASVAEDDVVTLSTAHTDIPATTPAPDASSSRVVSLEWRSLEQWAALILYCGFWIGIVALRWVLCTGRLGIGKSFKEASIAGIGKNRFWHMLWLLKK